MGPGGSQGHSSQSFQSELELTLRIEGRVWCHVAEGGTGLLAVGVVLDVHRRECIRIIMHISLCHDFSE